MKETEKKISYGHAFFTTAFERPASMYRRNIINTARSIVHEDNKESVMERYERNKALLRKMGVRETTLERGDQIMLNRAERYIRKGM